MSQYDGWPLEGRRNHEKGSQAREVQVVIETCSRQVEDRQVEDREVEGQEVEDQENHESEGRAKIEKISRSQDTIETQDCGEEGSYRGSRRGRTGRSRYRLWRAET